MTVEGVTRPVPDPFLVIATQNPAGSTGTQLLPEAQIDRFMISLSIGYPDFQSELSMAMGVSDQERLEEVYPVLSGEELMKIQKEISEIYIKQSVYEYLVELVRATRTHPQLEHGGSPRATIALVKMARASAWLKGRAFVTPVDVSEQFFYVMNHRICLSSSALMENVTKEEVLEEILRSVKKPSMIR